MISHVAQIDHFARAARCICELFRSSSICDSYGSNEAARCEYSSVSFGITTFQFELVQIEHGIRAEAEHEIAGRTLAR